MVQMKYVYDGKKHNTNIFNSFTDGVLKVNIRISVTVILGDKLLTFCIEQGTECYETMEYPRESLTAVRAVNRFRLAEIQPCMLISLSVQATI